MNYTDEQVGQADAALKMLHDAQGYVNSSKLWNVMGGDRQEYMIDQMAKVLHLTVSHSTSYMLTEEGERAYKMGFKAYVEERSRKAQEPHLVLTREEPRPWYKLNRAEWIGLVGVLIALIALVVALLK